MGGSSFSRDDYKARSTFRSATSTPVFAHTAAISAGKTAAKVHPSLSPKGLKIRESRDSVEHPVTVPIITLLDTTGSMMRVPEKIELALPKLMGHFLDDKASGKRYLGDGYPAIMIAAVDDYEAQVQHGRGGEGALQAGQFESGMEIDQNLENLWLTGNGGGTYQESYELGLYMAARHTAHDHMDKRGKKGYMFIIGDEHAYPRVKRDEVQAVFDFTIQDNIPFEQILSEAKDLYHVFFVIPNMTSHYHDELLERYWVGFLGQQNVLKLDNPDKICELIVSAVAICEQHATLDDLSADGIAVDALAGALVPLSKSAGTGLATHSAAGLPAVSLPLAADGGHERL